MASEDRAGQGSPPPAVGADGPGRSVEQGQTVAAQSGESLRDTRSPLFVAEHADRYQRQGMIREYEAAYDCRLIVMRDVIFPDSITYLEELLWDADPDVDLHLLLDSPGGDGETAVRLVRSAQARCRTLTVVVPDQAKSAATILAMGAHRILMGPTSDLGPVDPQFQIRPNGPLFAGKEIIAAVENAQKAIAEAPASYPLHAALLADVTALHVEQARAAIARTPDLVLEALMSLPGRSAEEASDVVKKLQQPLIDAPRNHGAVFGAADAASTGLPVESLDPRSDQWQRVWRLYAKYFVLGTPIYEGRVSSRVPRA